MKNIQKFLIPYVMGAATLLFSGLALVSQAMAMMPGVIAASKNNQVTVSAYLENGLPKIRIDQTNAPLDVVERPLGERIYYAPFMLSQKRAHEMFEVDGKAIIYFTLSNMSYLEQKAKHQRDPKLLISLTSGSMFDIEDLAADVDCFQKQVDPKVNWKRLLRKEGIWYLNFQIFVPGAYESELTMAVIEMDKLTDKPTVFYDSEKDIARRLEKEAAEKEELEKLNTAEKHETKKSTEVEAVTEELDNFELEQENYSL